MTKTVIVPEPEKEFRLTRVERFALLFGFAAFCGILMFGFLVVRPIKVNGLHHAWRQETATVTDYQRIVVEKFPEVNYTLAYSDWYGQPTILQQVHYFETRNIGDRVQIFVAKSGEFYLPDTANRLGHSDSPFKVNTYATNLGVVVAGIVGGIMAVYLSYKFFGWLSRILPAWRSTRIGRRHPRRDELRQLAKLRKALLAQPAGTPKIAELLQIIGRLDAGFRRTPQQDILLEGAVLPAVEERLAVMTRWQQEDTEAAKLYVAGLTELNRTSVAG